jgi:hypothetical protein
MAAIKISGNYVKWRDTAACNHHIDPTNYHIIQFIFNIFYLSMYYAYFKHENVILSNFTQSCSWNNTLSTDSISVSTKYFWNNRKYLTLLYLTLLSIPKTTYDLTGIG